MKSHVWKNFAYGNKVFSNYWTSWNYCFRQWIERYVCYFAGSLTHKKITFGLDLRESLLSTEFLPDQLIIYIRHLFQFRRGWSDHSLERSFGPTEKKEPGKGCLFLQCICFVRIFGLSTCNEIDNEISKVIFIFCDYQSFLWQFSWRHPIVFAVIRWIFCSCFVWYSYESLIEYNGQMSWQLTLRRNQQYELTHRHLFFIFFLDGSLVCCFTNKAALYHIILDYGPNSHDVPRSRFIRLQAIHQLNQS